MGNELAYGDTPIVVVSHTLPAQVVDGPVLPSAILVPIPGEDGQSLRIIDVVDTYAELPTVGVTRGDLFVVRADNLGYVWTGAGYPPIGLGIRIIGPQGETGVSVASIDVVEDTIVFTMSSGPSIVRTIPQLVQATLAAEAAAQSALAAHDSERIANEKAGEAATSAQSAKDIVDNAGGVRSLEGLTGVLTKAQLQIDQVDNTRDSEKPVSGPTQQAFTDLMTAIDGAFQGMLTSIDDKTTPAEAQAIATAAIAAWVGNTPEALDTLAELAAALGNRPNFAAEVLDLIGQKAAAVHKHSAADIETGTLPVARGGIGRGAVVNGSYFRGNGTEAVDMRTPVQVLSDIGAAPAVHTHNPLQIDGLADEFSYVYGALAAKVNTYPGQTITFWSGTQAAYDNLPTATKTAAGFIAAIY